MKPDLSSLRGPFLNYAARAAQFGDQVPGRARADWMAPTAGTAQDVARLRAQLAAVIRHVTSVLDSIEGCEALDPTFRRDRSLVEESCYAADPDSHLPQLAHAAQRLQMAITQAVLSGLLPADPGEPWTDP